MQRTVRNGTSHGLFIALVLAALGAVAPSGFARAAHDDAVEKTRLEKMLADGDNGMIVQVFRRHPGSTLPFIDHYFEGGLAMIEKGQQDPAATAIRALDSFRTGIKFAKLADEAFGGDAFSEYANSFASWSPSEQKSFRQGQRAYKEGAKETDPAIAACRLRQSLALARSLGDLWGQAMAYSALAELAAKSGDDAEALRLALLAADLNARLRLQEDAVSVLRLAAAASGKLHGPSASMQQLAQAWSIIEPDADFDAELRKQTLDDYLAALTASGFVDQAAAIRKEQAQAVADAAAQATTKPAGKPAT